MLDDLLAIARDPVSALSQRCAQSGRPLGVAFTPDFPLEVLDALGLEGAFLPPVQCPAYPAADRALQAFTCGYSRAVADVVLSGKLPIGLVAATSACDALTALPGIFLTARIAAPVLALRLPIAVGTAAARGQAVRALSEFCARASAALGVEMDLAALENACTAREQARASVARLLDGLGEGTCSAMHAYAAAIASHVLAPERLKTLLDSVDAIPVAPRPGPRVLVSGSVLPSLQVIEDIESLGAVVVADDTCTGTRGAARRVRRGGGGICEAIAASLVERPWIGPVRIGPAGARIREVVKDARRLDCRAAVLVHFKFCDPHAFEAPALLAALREAGVAGLVIEVDREVGLSPRERTRLQTMLEAL